MFDNVPAYGIQVHFLDQRNFLNDIRELKYYELSSTEIDWTLTAVGMKFISDILTLNRDAFMLMWVKRFSVDQIEVLLLSFLD